jgi:hypothetical protein
MVAAVPVLIGFGVYERHKKARNGSPLVDLDLFRQRSFVPGLLVAGIFFMGIPAFFLTFSLWLQIGFGFSALHAGLTGVPFAVGSALASAASVRLAPRLGRRIVIPALCWPPPACSGSSGRSSATAATPSPASSSPPLAVCGIGLGSVIAPLVNIVLAEIRRQDAGAASGVFSTVQQVGGAVGVAVIGVIFFGLLGSHAATVGNELAPRLRTELETAGMPGQASRQVVAGFRTCFQDRANAKDPSATRQLRLGAGRRPGPGRSGGGGHRRGGPQAELFRGPRAHPAVRGGGVPGLLPADLPAAGRPRPRLRAHGRGGGSRLSRAAYDPRRTPLSSCGGTPPTNPAAMVQPQASQDRAEWNDTVELLGLTRRYGDLIALDDVSFTVAEGRCSSRWPNGAGKTTAMRIGLGAGAQRW